MTVWRRCFCILSRQGGGCILLPRIAGCSAGFTGNRGYRNKTLLPELRTFPCMDMLKNVIIVAAGMYGVGFNHRHGLPFGSR